MSPLGAPLQGSITLLEKAILLAMRAHAGQKDKAGGPYLLHPLRVMLGVEGDEARQAAVLHDVVEDTPITLEVLRQEGFSEAVVTAVDALSRRPEEKYAAFIQRLKGNPLARRVKLADLADNMDLRRLSPPFSQRDLERMERYRRAWTELKEPD